MDKHFNIVDLSGDPNVERDPLKITIVKIRNCMILTIKKDQELIILTTPLNINNLNVLSKKMFGKDVSYADATKCTIETTTWQTFRSKDGPIKDYAARNTMVTYYGRICYTNSTDYPRLETLEIHVHASCGINLFKFEEELTEKEVILEKKVKDMEVMLNELYYRPPEEVKNTGFIEAKKDFENLKKQD